MLQSLSIRDVVLIDKLDLEFEEGLTVLTGETGAGKSILLDALGLALGDRADTSLIRADAEKAQVIATFKPQDSTGFATLLQENEIPFEDDIILLKRILSRDGRGKAFINDAPVSLNFLREVGGRLLEIHGQFDRLLENSSQAEALDHFAQTDLDTLSKAYRTYKDAQKSLKNARQNLKDTQVREAYLRVSLEELRALSPQVDEESLLMEKRKSVAHQAKIAQATEEALTAVGEPLTSRIVQALKTLTRIEEYLPAQATPILSQLEEALDILESAHEDIKSLNAQVHGDHTSLQALDERLYALRQMARKHQVEADNLPLLFHEMEQEFAQISLGEAGLISLEETLANARTQYLSLAHHISENRKKSAHELERLIQIELAPLKLGQVQFAVEFEELPEDRWTVHGLDSISFVVSTNPGSRPGHLAKVASGGELSRLMLALKVVLADKMAVPTMIFDEIDTGTGGAVADAMGERLRKLAQNVQILAITHSPQVATHGHHHLHVFKEIAGTSTRTHVTPLTHSDRIEEVARMLSGANITPEARAQAQRLLGRI